MLSPWAEPASVFSTQLPKAMQMLCPMYMLTIVLLGCGRLCVSTHALLTCSVTLAESHSFVCMLKFKNARRVCRQHCNGSEQLCTSPAFKQVLA